jgi:hypothetical protein
VQFRADFFSLHALPSQSLLSATLQAGLSALKTPMCSEVGERACGGWGGAPMHASVSPTLTRSADPIAPHLAGRPVAQVPRVQ